MFCISAAGANDINAGITSDSCADVVRSHCAYAKHSDACRQLVADFCSDGWSSLCIDLHGCACVACDPRTLVSGVAGRWAVGEFEPDPSTCPLSVGGWRNWTCHAFVVRRWLVAPQHGTSPAREIGRASC